MSAEVLAGTAAGVGMAGVALVFDQNLAMASAGGVAFFLGASITIPLQVRFWFGIGSFILGYIAGLVFMTLSDWGVYSPILAFMLSALGSAAFGSLNKWGNGGPTPGWIEFFLKLSPFRWKKDGDSNE